MRIRSKKILSPPYRGQALRVSFILLTIRVQNITLLDLRVRSPYLYYILIFIIEFKEQNPSYRVYPHFLIFKMTLDVLILLGLVYPSIGSCDVTMMECMNFTPSYLCIDILHSHYLIPANYY